MDKDVLILAIESSCDETAAAVVKNGRDVLSNIIYSQIELHKLYGGVVPEIASRKHIEKINPVITAALDEANVTLEDIDAIAVTYGPGLVGALLVGVIGCCVKVRCHRSGVVDRDERVIICCIIGSGRIDFTQYASVIQTKERFRYIAE